MMKRIFSYVLAGLALTTMFSCEEKINNDAYSDWLGQNYNQEILWNVDSLAFKRADWQKTALKQGAVLNAASIKMFESVQSVTYITYTSNSFFTKVGAPESGAAKISDTVGEKTVFAINGGSSYAKIDGVVKNDAVSTAGLGFTERGANGIVDVIANGDLTAYNSALAGTAVLVVDGVEQTIPSSAENDARMARSIFGVTKDGKYVMSVIDGGASGEADGATMAEAAFIARVMGLYNAVALSSGDDSSIWVANEGTVTDPSGADEGSVANYIYVEAIELFAGGDGSKGDPYQISNMEELNNMHSAAESGSAVYFKLTSDIDMEGMSWEPLNNAAPYDKGIYFDGDGYTISNFTCESASAYPSFFGILNGECKNVEFVNAYVSNGGNTSDFGIIGGQVGNTLNAVSGVVENCRIQGVVEHKQNAMKSSGGICGIMEIATVKNCHVNVICKFADGVVDTDRNRGIGAVVGDMLGNSNLENCFVEGEIRDHGVFNVGGILGRSCAKNVSNSGNNLIQNNISWLTHVEGRAAVGEICGRLVTTYANATEDCNYHKEGMTIVTEGKEADFRYGNEAKTDYASAGKPTNDAIKAAKESGWSTDIWDLSGTTPELKLFKK